MKLTGRWFPQIVDRDSGNLYPIYITKIVVLVSEPVRGRSRATELPCSMYVNRIEINFILSYLIMTADHCSEISKFNLLSIIINNSCPIQDSYL